jgi:tRNA (cytidine/uridine-2'-O-)-methyltransferase
VKYDPCLHIVLHQPEIPHNTGSVGRTCVAVGAKLWLVRPLGFRVDDYYLRRAGLDYWEHLEWEVADDWPALVSRLDTASENTASHNTASHNTARFWLFTKTAARPYTDIQFAPGDVFVFGSESSGLPASILEKHWNRALRIPTRSAVRSLNLSNAAAVAMYEALRQWNVRSSPLDGDRPGEPCL